MHAVTSTMMGSRGMNGFSQDCIEKAPVPQKETSSASVTSSTSPMPKVRVGQLGTGGYFRHLCKSDGLDDVLMSSMCLTGHQKFFL